jgi:uncharacterized damage-inducible protein DinB
MMITTVFKQYARYNSTANNALLTTLEPLGMEFLREDRGIPFRSLWGQLNHLVLTDTVWLSRFAGAPRQFASLGEELHTDWSSYHTERLRLDQELHDFAASLTEERLAGNLKFYSMALKKEVELPFLKGVLCVFDHQTHHRAQITSALRQASIAPPAIGMFFTPFEER